VKLAQGHLDLHSSRSRLDGAALARLLSELGSPEDVLAAARSAESVGEVAAMLSPKLRASLARRVAEGCREAALATLAGGTAVDVAVFDREGALLARTDS
jgi:cobalt-precorrin-5B (C1)-methyltransferase